MRVGLLVVYVWMTGIGLFGTGIRLPWSHECGNPRSPRGQRVEVSDCRAPRYLGVHMITASGP